MTLRVGILFFGLCSAVTLSGRMALGCERALSEAIEGALIAGWSTPNVPRNVAFVAGPRTPHGASNGESYLVGHLADGTEVVGTRSGSGQFFNGTFLVTLDAPLDAGVEIASTNGYSRYITTDVLDEVAPTGTAVRGGEIQFHDGNSACAKDSCGDYTYMRLEIPDTPSDDVASVNQLFYAVYLATSEAEARTKEQPDYLVYVDKTLYIDVNHSWMDRDAWVSIATVDMSAHFSERSEPVRVHEGDGNGCSFTHRSRGWSGAALLLVTAAAFVCRRRRPRKLDVRRRGSAHWH